MKIGNGGTFDEEATNFLNVDLDILSRSRLEPLVAAFGKNVSVHYVGAEGSRYGAHLSLYFPGNADKAIKSLSLLVNKLPAQARRLWNSALMKDFNIGIQGGIKPHSCEFPLSLATLSAVVKLGARVVITVYAAEPRSMQSQQQERDTRARPGKRRASATKKSKKVGWVERSDTHQLFKLGARKRWGRRDVP
jgi:hypothetical protein